MAAGIELPELAAEMDYPGGHTAMDGPHVDHEIAALRPDGLSDPPDGADRSVRLQVPNPAGLAAAAAVTAEDEAADAGRRDQLLRWHRDDSAVAPEQGADHDDGWS